MNGDDRNLAPILAQMQRELDELRRLTSNLPVRWARQGAGQLIRFGTATATWTSGNTITLRPVISSTSTTVTGEPDVTASIFLPSRGTPANVQIQQNDVVAYLSTGTNTGVVINANFGAFTSLGTLQYQVYQMTSNTVAGWDWLRAH